MSTLEASDNGLSNDLSTKNWITENGERGCNLLRGREALPAQPEKPFSARSGRGSDVQMAQRMELT